MPFKTGIILVILGLILIVGVGYSQDKPSNHQPMIWIEAIEHVRFSQRFSTTLLWHHRIFLDQPKNHQNVYWASLNMKITRRFNLSGGLIYFTNHKMSSGNYLVIPETRPFQYISYHTKVAKLKTTFRLMVEERYQSKVNEGVIMKGHYFSWRFRSRVRLDYPLSDQVNLEMASELILNRKKPNLDRFSQTRTRVRLHYNVGRFNFNLGYLHWLVNANGMQHRNSLMVGVKHRLDF